MFLEPFSKQTVRDVKGFYWEAVSRHHVPISPTSLNNFPKALKVLPLLPAGGFHAKGGGAANIGLTGSWLKAAPGVCHNPGWFLNLCVRDPSLWPAFFHFKPHFKAQGSVVLTSSF